MNTQIKKLLAEALDNNTVIASRAFGHWPLYDEDLEKFAELIVNKCLSIIETEAAQYAEPVWAFEIVNDIKEHFEVKQND